MFWLCRSSHRVVYILQPQSKQLHTITQAKRLCRRWTRAFHIKAVIIIIGLDRLPSNYYIHESRVEGQWHGWLSNRHTGRRLRWRARCPASEVMFAGQVSSADRRVLTLPCRIQLIGGGASTGGDHDILLTINWIIIRVLSVYRMTSGVESFLN